MRFFRNSLIVMATCLISIWAGVLLGLKTENSLGRYYVYKTDELTIKLNFSPNSSDLTKMLGIASLRLYSDALSICLSEPDSAEKIVSARVLSDGIAGSFIMNMLRHRESSDKNNGQKHAPGKNFL